jgi:LysM repeat protein
MNRTGIALIGVICFLIVVLVAWGDGAAGDGPIPTVEVRVEPGDTLWSLARRHADDSIDVRELIGDIRRINHLDDTVIRPGQTLKIPVRKED